jgi:isopropylmalate/homocitrate/citramalate synthase
MLPRRVQIVEVGPRDGLQNEPALVPPAEKVAFVNRLTEAGHSIIEVAAFVSPRWVQQMADSAEVFASIARRDGVRYTALVPNLTGLQRARDARVSEIAIFAAASQTFSRKNINQSIAESLATYRSVCEDALAADIRVRAYLSTSFGCPFEGPVPPETVADLAARLLDLGVYQVALSDTIGVAHPGQIPEVVSAVSRRIPLDVIALHLHDTRGTALVNVYAGLEAGITTYDASAGGLGGCPYAPGAAGNLATEDLVYMLDGLGIETGVRLEGVVTASREMERWVGHPLPSRAFRAAMAMAPTNHRDTESQRLR